MSSPAWRWSAITLELAEKLGYLQNAVGGVLDPFSSFLTLRGIRTLALRDGATQRERAAARRMAGTAAGGRASLVPGWPRTRTISWALAVPLPGGMIS